MSVMLGFLNEHQRFSQGTLGLPSLHVLFQGDHFLKYEIHLVCVIDIVSPVKLFSHLYLKVISSV